MCQCCWQALALAKSDMGAMRTQIETLLQEQAKTAEIRVLQRHEQDTLRREVLDLQRALVNCRCGARKSRSYDVAAALVEKTPKRASELPSDILMDAVDEAAANMLLGRNPMGDGFGDRHGIGGERQGHGLNDLYEQYAWEASERERTLRSGAEEAVLPNVPVLYTSLYDTDGKRMSR